MLTQSVYATQFPDQGQILNYVRAVRELIDRSDIDLDRFDSRIFDRLFDSMRKSFGEYH